MSQTSGRVGPAQLDNQLVYLLDMLDTTTAAPPAAVRERYAELSAELDEIVGELDALLAAELPKLEALLDAAAAPHIVDRADEVG